VNHFCGKPEENHAVVHVHVRLDQIHPQFCSWTCNWPDDLPLESWVFPAFSVPATVYMSKYQRDPNLDGLVFLSKLRIDFHPHSFGLCGVLARWHMWEAGTRSKKCVQIARCSTKNRRNWMIYIDNSAVYCSMPSGGPVLVMLNAIDLDLSCKECGNPQSYLDPEI